MDLHQQQVTVLTLTDGIYQETIFRTDARVISPPFTDFQLTVKDISMA